MKKLINSFKNKAVCYTANYNVFEPGIFCGEAVKMSPSEAMTIARDKLKIALRELEYYLIDEPAKLRCAAKKYIVQVGVFSNRRIHYCTWLSIISVIKMRCNVKKTTNDRAPGTNSAILNCYKPKS
jgi:hypothetical protein